MAGRFQFYISTIQLGGRRRSVSAACPFQFYISTIQFKVYTFNVHLVPRFQFYISTIQLPSEHAFELIKKISILHKYDSVPHLMEFHCLPSHISILHKYDSVAARLRNNGMTDEFQFYISTIQFQIQDFCTVDR